MTIIKQTYKVYKTKVNKYENKIGANSVRQ